MAPSDLQSIDRRQVESWQMQGIEPVWQRGTCRLPQYKKTFPPDLQVTVRDPETDQYVPLILSCGRPLLASEALPERADLALDEEGHLLTQGDFEGRFKDWLGVFGYPDGSDINFEPVPNVVDYITRTPDPWSESNGMVEIGFDAKPNAEFKPKQRFGPNGETEEQWKREQGESNREFARALVQEMLAAQRGEAPEESAPADPDPETAGMDSAEASTATTEGGDQERMPCGVWKKKRYRKQHMRFCNDEACGGPGQNSKDDDG